MAFTTLHNQFHQWLLEIGVTIDYQISVTLHKWPWASLDRPHSWSVPYLKFPMLARSYRSLQYTCSHLYVPIRTWNRRIHSGLELLGIWTAWLSMWERPSTSGSFWMHLGDICVSSAFGFRFVLFHLSCLDTFKKTLVLIAKPVLMDSVIIVVLHSYNISPG